MTTRTLYVTGGYAPPIVTDVRFRTLTVEQLEAASCKVALLGRDAQPPAKASTDWNAATVVADAATRTLTVTYLVEAGDPGLYRLWVLLEVGPVSVPVLVLGDDREPLVVRLV